MADNGNYVKIDLGKITVRPRGEYSASEVYDYLDIVTFNNSSYISKVSNNKGNYVTDTFYWQVLADVVGGQDVFDRLTQLVNQALENSESAKDLSDNSNKESALAMNTAENALEASNISNSQASEAKGAAQSAESIATKALEKVSEQSNQIKLNTPQMVMSEEAMEEMITRAQTVEGQVYWVPEEV